MAQGETGGATPLMAALARRIAQSGPITVADYMAAAVEAYYGTRDPLGAGGDFITAPETSQVFGELLGLWCADLWQRMGAPDPVLLVELGPGRGTMLTDALRAVRVMPGFAAAIRLHLVERSAALRATQAERLAAFGPVWHDSFSEVPAGPMLLLANEFVDALPVRQFVRARDGWHERLVGLAGDPPRLAFVEAAERADDPALGVGPPGAIRELRPAARELALALGARLAATGGAALFVDYGHDGGFGDTLQAVRRHSASAVLDAPGEADLTSHVDFAAFAAAAERGGARVWGPVAQGAFLTRLGIEARAARLIAAASDDAASLIRSGCRRLIDPAEMGNLFRVIALASQSGPVPAGFA